MQPGFEDRWRQARSLENQGQVEPAKAIYETLLGEDPDRLYVRLRLGAIEKAAGNYLRARAHALRCADDVRHARWKDLAAVTLNLLAFDEWSVVRELIMGTDWNHPDVIRNSAALSQHLWLIGDVAKSLQLIDIAIAHAPGNGSLRYSRANALRYLGRMVEATGEYERCLAMKPDDAYVHWSLANHESAKPAGSRIDRIRRAQGAYPPDSAEQPYLHYALFKEYEGAGELGKAWHQLERGAAIKRRQVRYDPAVEAAGFDVLRDLIDARFAAPAHAIDVQAPVPIFIIGMPRSGTTLLERILGSHADVTPAGELNAFGRALSIESNQFLGHYTTPRTVQRLAGIDFAGAGRHYIEQTRPWAKGKRYLIDKNPANFVHAGFIGKAIPQARIVCLRRDPMDACMSNFKNLFSNDAYGYSYQLGELADYYARFDQLCAHWRDVLGDRFLEVEYEQLVGDPATISRKVMDHCGLAFDPALVDITRNASPVTTASSSQVREPINTRGIGAWRKYEAWLEPLRVRLADAFGQPGR